VSGAGPLPNADVEEPAGLGGCPSGMALVEAAPPFCVDRFEAFLVELVDGVEQPWSPFLDPAARSVRAKSAPGAVPQGYVSQLDAAGACAAAGKRLCTDEEWLRACAGAAGTTYPYGDERAPGTCNDARAGHPAVERYGPSDAFDHLDDSCLNQLEDTVDPAGANAGCVSPEGIFDLVGNLREWTADPGGTLRGGFYLDTEVSGSGCRNLSTAQSVSDRDFSTGFRCCAEAP
jgi:formylglycine-generating enzyme